VEDVEVEIGEVFPFRVNYRTWSVWKQFSPRAYLSFQKVIFALYGKVALLLRRPTGYVTDKQSLCSVFIHSFIFQPRCLRSH